MSDNNKIKQAIESNNLAHFKYLMSPTNYFYGSIDDQFAIFKVLIESGASVTKLDYKGRSVLDYCYENSEEESLILRKIVYPLLKTVLPVDVVEHVIMKFL